MKATLRKYLLPWVVLWLYRLFFWSWRTRVEEPPELQKALKENAPIVFAHWHGHELILAQMVRRYKLATMTSMSKDGQLIDFVVIKLGGVTSKGSSSRGAVGALKGMVRLVRAGHPASMAVDGPRGPIYEVKPGVFELSRLAKAKVFPVGIAASNTWISKKSWNQAILPKPFSPVAITYGDSMGPITSNQDPKSADLSASLKQRISDACQQASKLIDS
ncbi:MAG: lysophospholipid acyltransferase family protein [Pseudomonadota bacterium]